MIVASASGVRFPGSRRWYGQTGPRQFPNPPVLGLPPIQLTAGQVLVPRASASYRYNLSTNTWTARAAAPVTAVGYIVCATLSAGRVLRASIGDAQSLVLSYSHVFDDAANAWTARGPSAAITFVGAVIASGNAIGNSRVLVVGFDHQAGSGVVWDDTTNTQFATATSSHIRSHPAVAMLSPGRALVSGGLYSQWGPNPPLGNPPSEIYDANSNSWTPLGFTLPADFVAVHAAPDGALVISADNSTMFHFSERTGLTQFANSQALNITANNGYGNPLTPLTSSPRTFVGQIGGYQAYRVFAL